MQYNLPDKLQAVIFDWAGTTVDFGSFAPTRVFVEAFSEFGLDISLEEARGPMGMGKWDHIKTLLNTPAIRARWEAKHGKSPTDEDMTDIYNRFMPLQLEKIALYSDLVPGVSATVEWLREQNIKIGSCSGYPHQIMEKVAQLAAKRGYRPDYWVATDEVPVGRPSPGQSLKNAITLQVDDVAACVKVDDTAPGLLEGRRAGMWVVAVLLSGNHLGLTYEDFEKLSESDKEAARERIKALLKPSGAHYYIDTVAHLPDVVKDINRRLAEGIVPQQG